MVVDDIGSQQLPGLLPPPRCLRHRCRDVSVSAGRLLIEVLGMWATSADYRNGSISPRSASEEDAGLRTSRRKPMSLVELLAYAFVARQFETPTVNVPLSTGIARRPLGDTP